MVTHRSVGWGPRPGATADWLEDGWWHWGQSQSQKREKKRGLVCAGQSVETNSSGSLTGAVGPRRWAWRWDYTGTDRQDDHDETPQW